MQRLGHTTVSAALAYQHAAKGSDKRIAAQLSEVALGHLPTRGSRPHP